jgi:hypothetical protein
MELSLAWMRDEVSTSEVQRRLKTKATCPTIYRMGVAIRQSYREGLLKQAQ